MCNTACIHKDVMYLSIQLLGLLVPVRGNSVDQLSHARSVAYSVQLVLLNKHQISGGGANLHCYPVCLRADTMGPYCDFSTGDDKVQ